MINKTENKEIKIYAVKHPAFREDAEILIEADSMQEAIEKFNHKYEHDYDVVLDKIECVILKYDLEVIS